LAGRTSNSVIYKRGDRYGVRIYRAGRQEWVGTFDRKKDAKDAERKAERQLRPSQDETCTEFADRWLREFPRPRASTNAHYEQMLKPFRVEFGEKKMAEVSRRAARQWATHHRGSVPVVRAMFNDALNEGEVVVVNPFANLGLAQKRGRKDLRPLSREQLYELADTAPNALGPQVGTTIRAAILFAAFVGLRPAEMFVLKRSSIQGDEVYVCDSLGSTGVVTAPKNGHARRVFLPPPAREALRQMPSLSPSPYVFNNRSGARFSKTSFFYYWNTVRAAYGKPGMDFYELRHFCATHLLELGLRPSDVAVQLGHTDGGALVMDTYGHPSEDDARNRLRSAFGAPVPRLHAV